MGQGQQPQFCKPKFYLENQWQKSGQLMKGIIYLEVEKDTHYDRIYMKLISEQLISDSESLQNVTTYQDQFILLNFDGNKLLKGQYEIPFQLRLPKNLPGTAIFRLQTNQIRCKIALEFVNSQNKKETQIHKYPINVVKIQPQQRLVASRVESIAYCCCCGIGNLEISAQIDKNWAFAGESVHIKGKIINDSTSPVTIYHKLFNKFIQKNSKWSHSLGLSSKSQKNIGTSSASQFALNVKLPQNISTNTTHGFAVANQYAIVIKCDPGCFKTSVQIKLPLNIYKREINNPSGQIIHLQRWDPFIFDVIRYEGLEPYNRKVKQQNYYFCNSKYASKELKLEDSKPEPKKKNLMIEEKEGFRWVLKESQTLLITDFCLPFKAIILQTFTIKRATKTSTQRKYDLQAIYYSYKSFGVINQRSTLFKKFLKINHTNDLIERIFEFFKGIQT